MGIENIKLPKTIPACIDALIYNKSEKITSYIAEPKNFHFATKIITNYIHTHIRSHYSQIYREENIAVFIQGWIFKQLGVNINEVFPGYKQTIEESFYKPFNICKEIREKNDCPLQMFCKMCHIKKDEMKKQTMFDTAEAVEWIKQKTENVSLHYGRGTSYYTITIDQKTFNIKDEELLIPKKFQIWYYNNFAKMLRIDTTIWDNLLEFWAQEAETKSYETFDEDTGITEYIINKLQSSKPVDNIEETFYRDDRVFIDAEDGNKIYYPTASMKKILEREKYKIELRRLRMILSDYLLSNTTKIRVGNQTARFWVFDNKKIGIEKPSVSYEKTDDEKLDKNVKEGKLF